jgi:hypothetical protein
MVFNNTKSVNISRLLGEADARTIVLSFNNLNTGKSKGMVLV